MFKQVSVEDWNNYKHGEITFEPNDYEVLFQSSTVFFSFNLKSNNVTMFSTKYTKNIFIIMLKFAIFLSEKGVSWIKVKGKKGRYRLLEIIGLELFKKEDDEETIYYINLDKENIIRLKTFIEERG